MTSIITYITEALINGKFFCVMMIISVLFVQCLLRKELVNRLESVVEKINGVSITQLVFKKNLVKNSFDKKITT